MLCSYWLSNLFFGSISKNLTISPSLQLEILMKVIFETFEIPPYFWQESFANYKNIAIIKFWQVKLWQM